MKYKKESLDETLFNVGFALLILAFVALSGYLFYFEECSTVKKYYAVAQMPGRCIDIN